MPRIDQIQLSAVQKIVIPQIGSDKCITTCRDRLRHIVPTGAATHCNTADYLPVILITQTVTTKRFYHKRQELCKGYFAI